MSLKILPFPNIFLRSVIDLASYQLRGIITFKNIHSSTYNVFHGGTEQILNQKLMHMNFA